ncbi:hypothetical protein JKF63_07483 [Porcisia hertigi]|uniref:PUM-HD domain-containing protein n=1 Tax=Porcisia hertigi TaxID=2761500 RepID=A0A836IUJ3_9TRYP|nr:hypothetical protein JKF63_07483 [Porcisia hertigi]
MFAQAESEELLHLLSQVRLVADEEARSEQKQQHLNTGCEHSTPQCTPSADLSAGALGKGISNGSTASLTSGGGSALGRYTASSTAAVTSSWTVRDNTESVLGINSAAPSGSCLADYEKHHANPMHQPPVSRTPATDVKVLLQRSDKQVGDTEDNLAKRDDRYMSPHPKQLLFTSPSAPTQATAVKQRQTPPPHARQSVTPTHPSTVYTTATSPTAGTLASQPIDNTSSTLPVAVKRNGSGYTGEAAEVTILQTTTTVKDMSSVLSSYARPDVTAVAEGGLEGVPRMAPAVRREGGDGNGEEGLGLMGGGADRLSDAWTPARNIGTPHSALDGSSQSIGLLHLQQQKQSHLSLYPRYVSPSSPSSMAEAALAQLFRASSSGDVLYNAGHEGARRASVEAELAELQRSGGCLSAGGPAGVRVHGTPISMVSPLPPASTTPYHQLLSQLRHSPSQVPVGGFGSANAAFAGAAARAYTPPARPPLTYSSRLGTTGPTSLYTANITNMQRPSSAAASACASMEQSHSCWPRASPFERPTVVTAAPGSNVTPAPGAAALFRTPDTVSKPVTLSSIAAHLHDGVGNRSSPDNAHEVPPHAHDPCGTHASPLASTTALERAFRPTRTAQPFSLSSPSQHSPPSSATTGARVSPCHVWYRGNGTHKPGQHPHTAPLHIITTTAMALPPPPPPPPPPPASAQSPATAAGSHKSHQSHVPASSMRRWSPVDASPPATAAGTIAGNAYKTNSPPSCTLRPSPHPRLSNGSSPALRRYTIIATPSGPVTGTTAANSASSGGKNGMGRSPHGASGTSAATRGTSREARPRVQLWQSPHTTGGAGRSARGSLNTTHRVGADASPSSSPHHPNPSSHVSRQLGSSSTSAVASVGTGASMVSASAVQALIKRLQAAAATILPTPPPVSTTVPGVGQLSFTAEERELAGVTAVPDVASAPIILAMSHDQQGCRLLQAVIDAECYEAESLDDEQDDLTTTDDAVAVSSLMMAEACPEEKRGGVVNSVSERRRRRRAKAFENSVPVRVVLQAIEPKLDAVMADGYGNFLLQKIFDMAPDTERQRLLRLPSLQHHLCEVACSPHGTFAVQRLVETVRNIEEERLVFVALERDLLRLLTNANGGHVLMKVMECIRRQYTALTCSATNTSASASASTTASDESGTAASSRRLLGERVDALFQAIQQHLLYVCQHKQGCCIVQKCLDFLHACAGLSPTPSSAAGTQMDYFERMAALLLPHVQELSTHPFGNYVVTRLVDVCYTRGNTNTIDAVAAVMQRDFLRMCTNKFASNVIEHILRHCSERRIRLLCQSLMVAPVSSTSSARHPTGTAAGAVATANAAIARLPLTTVVMDPYGNYVVQTLLTVAPVDELVSTSAEGGGMLPVLQQLLPLLSSRNYGRKLETKTELALLRVEQSQQQ